MQTPGAGRPSRRTTCRVGGRADEEHDTYIEVTLLSTSHGMEVRGLGPVQRSTVPSHVQPRDAREPGEQAACG